MIGTDQRDVITGDDGANRIEGGDAGGGVLVGTSSPAESFSEILGGGDLITDGAGADEILAGGGDGVVRLAADGETELALSSTGWTAGVDFSLATSAVTADLSAQGTTDLMVQGGGLGDQSGTEVSGYQALGGSDHDDDLRGGTLIYDGAGQDRITVADGGWVYLDADGVAETEITGVGAEFVFVFATGAVTVDLGAQGTSNAVITGGGVGDEYGTTVSGFTGVWATAFDDAINGSDDGDRLDASSGADVVRGLGGNDTIDGGDGADTLSGGDGADVFQYNQHQYNQHVSYGDDLIEDFDGNAGDMIELQDLDGQVSLEPNTTLQDPLTDVGGFFASRGVTGGVVAQDNGDDLSRVLVDFNGDGDFTSSSGSDLVFDLTGTLSSAGIDAAVFGLGDTAGITVTPTTGLETTEAGGTASFAVVLDSEPTAEVTIAVASSDPGEGTVSTDTLTFTPSDWDTAQTVTVTGVDDAEDDGDQGSTITLGAASSTDTDYNGLDPDDVTVTNTDDDGAVPLAPSGDEVTVAAATGDQADPTITALSGGGFAVMWEDGSESGGDGCSYAVRGQAFGAEFLVNSTIDGNQSDPALSAVGDDGKLLAVWESDGIGLDLVGQVFDVVDV